MPSVTLAPASGRYLSFSEREEIALLRAGGAGVRAIAREVGRSKLAVNDELRRYVQERLSGAVKRPDGAAVVGPHVPWKGRRHGRRSDRRWAMSWSPEQISGRLRLDFPDDASMRVSHEAIYQSLYVQGRGALTRELTACLQTGRALRVPRARVRRGKGFLTDEVMISQRPAEADDRAVPGTGKAI
jgi:IS30 family transposase